MTNTGKPTARVAALSALSEDQQKKLAAFARTVSKGTGDDGNDVLHGAILRWLDSNVPVEGAERTYHFLRDAMQSIASNIFRHKKIVRRVEGVRVTAAHEDGADPIELAPDQRASQEETLFAQQLYDLTKDDSEVQSLLMYQAERTSRTEIMKEMGWDNKKYDAVHKRTKRLIARLAVEGKLR